MFVFEDLLLIDQNGIKEILARVDRKILTVALKGTSDQLRLISWKACPSAAPKC